MRFDEAITTHQEVAVIFRETGDKAIASARLKNDKGRCRDLGAGPAWSGWAPSCATGSTPSPLITGVTGDR